MTRIERSSSTARRLGAVLCVASLAFAAFAASASADFGIRGFEASFETKAGAPAAQAGSHPGSLGADVLFDVETRADQEGIEKRFPIDQAKDVDVELPPGLIGDPSVLPKCPTALLLASVECPADTKIGVARVYFAPTAASEPPKAAIYPLYNAVPTPDVPGFFGFVVPGYAAVSVTATVRPAEPGSTDGYGLDLHIANIPQALSFEGAGISFEGVPAAASAPFVTMPTSCSGQPLELHADATSWEGGHGEAELVVRDPAGEPLRIDGCDRVPFEPKIATALDTASADSPSGLTVDVQTPQNPRPEGLATAHLKSTTVTLPAGVSIDPSAANGLTGCSLAQLDQFGAAPSTCPDGSKVGTVDIDTPLVADPIVGGVYLARQKENPFGSLLALYLVGEGDGIRVKLPGEVRADPATGQLTATFAETPQLPFEELRLHLFDGPGAALATPVTCGTRGVDASLAPWSGNAPTALVASLATTAGPGGSACPPSAGARPFAPALEAGTVSPAAGLHTPLGLTVTRPDGSQELGRIEATLPKGLLANLRGVPECGSADAAAGTCAAASQVGSLVAGAGAGPAPFYVKSGRAYLTGPYAGAPLGLDFVVPVVAGPLDLGDVNVRAALFVDPATTQVTVRSDPLPQILAGIPLRLRSIGITVDRPGFVVNPTSCDPTRITGKVTSTEGATANLGERFQAAGCRGLAFSPKVAAKLLGGRKALRRGGHPRLRVSVTEPAGEANVARTTVRLPRSLFLDQSHIRTVCTRVQFAAEACPPASVYGFAKVNTPLLDRPLEGPVYLRSSDHPLPDLVFDLRGQLRLVLAGRIDSKGGGIRVALGQIPDAAFSSFVLRMKGGARGLLQSSTELCAAKPKVTASLVGQNGDRVARRPSLARACAKGSRR